eukprot:COSAG01_NODE_1060_length_11890_cov_17.763973_5_plen_50_part_00
MLLQRVIVTDSHAQFSGGAIFAAQLPEPITYERLLLCRVRARYNIVTHI